MPAQAAIKIGASRCGELGGFWCRNDYLQLCRVDDFEPGDCWNTLVLEHHWRVYDGSLITYPEKFPTTRQQGTP